MDLSASLLLAIESWGAHEYHDQWTERDAITYAVASGADLEDLPLLWERAPLQVLPTFASRLGGRAVQDLHAASAHLGLMSFASRLVIETFGPLPFRSSDARSVATARVTAHEQTHVVGTLTVETSVDGQLIARTTTDMHHRLPADKKVEKPSATTPTIAEPVWTRTASDTVQPYQGAAFRLLLGVNADHDLQDGIHIDPQTARAVGLPAPSLQGEVTLGLAARHAVRLFAPGHYAAIQAISGRFSGRVDLIDELNLNFAEPEDDQIVFNIVNASGRVVMSDGQIRLGEGNDPGQTR